MICSPLPTRRHMANLKEIPQGVQAEFPDAVAHGARVLTPAQDQFWGDRTARIIDPSGHVWVVASRIEETTEAQRAARWSGIREGERRS